ncbi:antibiotic biosynthesis monooxygenase family protein [Roseospira visakhapatnamensis]|uniref:Heme-degrading monooxygenase HmoA n=1 Tax=Roseospira visakhapatnamensis TaxID=390880 RepID=A0A7W6RGF3_9PROT|nr:antibiotic biosynthesis monooxygenase [Roseospira visakhapatnamensis]MBB4267982.1 heme-degrading monooxygenase HmoA [Roseospira visakhapatnamensis]
MFIAMNRFEVWKHQADSFEAVWTTRESRLRGQPGFVSFTLLRLAPDFADDTSETVLFASHTAWRTLADFETWTRSQAFRDAHKDGGQTRDMLKGAPRFEGFTVVQAIEGNDTT